MTKHTATPAGKRRYALEGISAEAMQDLHSVYKTGAGVAKALGVHPSAVSHHKRRAPGCPAKHVKATPRCKTFVITSAVNATPVHRGFIDSLRTYCDHNSAKLMIIPLRYKNHNSHWSKDQADDDWWDASTVAHLVAEKRALANGLVVLGNVKTQPTASNPLQGFETITGSDSAVIGHPQIASTTVPTPQHKLPKILVTTGACTVANYTESKAGARGEFHHSLGAVVVEVEKNGVFHMRHLVACDDGTFEDLDTCYNPAGTSPNGGVAALVMGDSHVDFIDDDVVAATFTSPKNICEVLRPKLLVWHDILDCYSVSHHHVHDPIIQFAKHHAGRNDIAKEVNRTLAFVDKFSPTYCQNLFVPSNHVDHLSQWVRSCDPRKDHQNAMIWAELYTAMCSNSRVGPGGVSTIDPFIHLAKRDLKCACRSIFLERGESFSVHGIELGMHGDRGPNGSRGSRKALDKIGTRSIVGHSHSPGISGGVYQTGTSSRYDLEYAVGSPSSWLHTHCVVYKNGKRSLINIVGQAWRG